MVRSFRSYGGVAQLHLRDASDLEAIEVLDEARWAATSVPTVQFNCDPGFLRFLDADGDGRVRLHDVREAQRWTWAHLAERSRLDLESDELHLGDLDPDHPETSTFRDLASFVRNELELAEDGAIRLDELRRFRSQYARTRPNGDGVITAAQAGDEELEGLLTRILETTGGVVDVSGDLGVGVEQLDAFVDAAKTWLAWHRAGQTQAVRVLGDATVDAAALLDGLEPKLRAWFELCDLVAVEQGVAGRVQASADELAAFDRRDAAQVEHWLDGAPIAPPRTDGVLDLLHRLHPRFRTRLARLRTEVGPALLGQLGPLRQLDRGVWAALQAALSPYRDHVASRPTAFVDDPDPAELVALLESPLPERLRTLATEDASVAQEVQRFDDLEKLILYQRWLLEFCRNFVEMSRLFDLERPALFQEGTLVIDGRKVRLCLEITDVAAHKKIATGSLIFLAYVELTRRDGEGQDLKRQLVAGVTAGVQGGIGVGKRGVFYDREDLEWDALVTDVVANPISLWEAMIAPFVRLRKRIEDRLETALGERGSGLEADLAQKAEVEVPVEPPGELTDEIAEAAQDAQRRGGLQNLLIGGSVAFAALASSAAFVVDVMSRISVFELFGAVGTLVLSLLIISALSAWLRLRKRDLSTFLEAAGFALNGRMHLDRSLAGTFTRRPGLPPGVRVGGGSTLRTGLMLCAILLLAMSVAGLLGSALPWLMGLL